jgi:hypothetical protein
MDSSWWSLLKYPFFVCESQYRHKHSYMYGYSPLGTIPLWAPSGLTSLKIDEVITPQRYIINHKCLAVDGHMSATSKRTTLLNPGINPGRWKHLRQAESMNINESVPHHKVLNQLGYTQFTLLIWSISSLLTCEFHPHLFSVYLPIRVIISPCPWGLTSTSKRIN